MRRWLRSELHGQSVFSISSAQLLRDVLRAHEGFADEDGADAGGADAADVLRGLDAAFADADDVVGDFLGQFLGGGEIDLEGFQVAVVDADEVGAEFERAVHFAQVVHLHQHVELAGLRAVVERAQLRRRPGWRR